MSGVKSHLIHSTTGAQSAWNTVFFYQYLVPLITYLLFYFSVWPGNLIVFYSITYLPVSLITATPNKLPFNQEYASHAAMVAHSVHYCRRLFEVFFVHRFSSATLAVRHIPKYCAFYGACTAWMAYVINHPAFTPPSDLQVFISFIFFILGEIGAVR